MSSSESVESGKKCRCGGNDVSTIDSRSTAGTDIIPHPWAGGVIRRRHSCNVCGKRWTSYQIDVDDLNALKEVAREESIPDAIAHIGVRDGHLTCLGIEHADEVKAA